MLKTGLGYRKLDVLFVVYVPHVISFNFNIKYK